VLDDPLDALLAGAKGGRGKRGDGGDKVVGGYSRAPALRANVGGRRTDWASKYGK